MTTVELPSRVLIDIDGVCYLRGTRIAGAAEAAQLLSDEGHSIVYVTNNSWDVPSTYEEALAALGFPVRPGQVITSSIAAATLLAEGEGESGLLPLAPQSMVAVLGGPGIIAALSDAGFHAEAVDSLAGVRPRDVDAVVVGVDRDLSYSRLSEAARLVREGVPFIATNTDSTFPSEAGLLPGAGSIVGAVSIASGVVPVVAGKPEAGLARAAEVLAGSSAGGGDGLVIGDRLETDIRFARRHGYMSGLVLTGVSRIGDLGTTEDLPDLVGANLLEVISNPVRLRRTEAGPIDVSEGDESLRRSIHAVVNLREVRAD